MGSEDFGRGTGEAFVSGMLRGAFVETKWGYVVVGLVLLSFLGAIRSVRRTRRRGGRRYARR